MVEIKAIETEYNGYKFRSRLEARWAVFFDSLGIKYEYEPEGFELPSGAMYLPDFKVKCFGTRISNKDEPFDLYIEVKGFMSKSDSDRILEFSRYNPVLVVGNIPKSVELLDDEEWERKDDGNVYFFNFETVDGDHYAAYPAVDEEGFFYLVGGDYTCDGCDIDRTDLAYAIARQARFEYGEKPNIRW